MAGPSPDHSLRPRDFALLLLASPEMTPRQRARDQQADLAGLELKRRVLNALVEHDPEPSELEAALMNLVVALGPPTGPTRAIALALAEEWHAVATNPDGLAYLLSQAVRGPEGESKRHGRQLPG